ncbi:MAG: HAD family phosphatase [Richelia sp. RM2_1_2]|nr:HAD family phosphatase [Richelia sp. RM2_1_2]
MTKALGIDLDGTIIDIGPQLHRDIFIKSVSKYINISKEFHDKYLKSLSTKQKLEILNKKLNLPKNLNQKIWNEKQEITAGELAKLISFDEKICDIFSELSLNVALYVCTNSIRKTTKTILKKLNILDFLTGVICSDDVANPKPAPDMYNILTTTHGARNVAVVEDSETGVAAALAAQCHIFKVKNSSEFKSQDFQNKIKSWIKNND